MAEGNLSLSTLRPDRLTADEKALGESGTRGGTVADSLCDADRAAIHNPEVHGQVAFNGDVREMPRQVLYASSSD